ncbi:replication protein [Sulfurimonas sediminis]|uniref:Replication protein n=1 Tax=Sulfurimonas sediminis TaxID=2590020 RepID=A0A7M1AYH3_9BACT|nr:replication protein [Sulfurimonas sediminis]QOP42494.1 replication protein [Sulfurimonas sediminis]
MELIENFTKVPNECFYVMRFVNGSTYKIYFLIVRKTFGYNKKSDGISISQFVKETGVSQTQVKKSINELKELKLIRVLGQTKKDGGKSYNRYSINLKAIDTLGQKVSKGRAESDQGVGQKVSIQNTIKQKKREIKAKKTNFSKTALTLADIFRDEDENQINKHIENYLDYLVSVQEYVKNKNAFKIAVKRKINKGVNEQLEDLEEWYLSMMCKKFEERYKGETIIYNSEFLEVLMVYPYFRTEGFNRDDYIFIGIGTKEQIETDEYATLKMSNFKELEIFLKKSNL